MAMERPIPGFPLYTVSDDGTVRSLITGQEIRGDNPRGYRRVKLSENKKAKRVMVHRLVLLAFVGPCPAKHEANHKNGKPSDNRLENLEYVTKSYNQWHCNHVIKTRKPQQGSKHGMSRITEELAINIRAARDAGESLKNVAARFGVSSPTVSMIASGKTWKHVVPQGRSRPRFRAH